MEALSTSREQRVRTSWVPLSYPLRLHTAAITPPPRTRASLAFQQILFLEPIGTGFSGAGDSSKRLAERTCLLATLEVGWDRV